MCKQAHKIQMVNNHMEIWLILVVMWENVNYNNGMPHFLIRLVNALENGFI
jgi:hypothetical protein